jgi:hypothetical protein
MRVRLRSNAPPALLWKAIVGERLFDGGRCNAARVSCRTPSLFTLPGYVRGYTRDLAYVDGFVHRCLGTLPTARRRGALRIHYMAALGDIDLFSSFRSHGVLW